MTPEINEKVKRYVPIIIVLLLLCNIAFVLFGANQKNKYEVVLAENKVYKEISKQYIEKNKILDSKVKVLESEKKSLKQDLVIAKEQVKQLIDKRYADVAKVKKYSPTQVSEFIKERYKTDDVAVTEKGVELRDSIPNKVVVDLVIGDSAKSEVVLQDTIINNLESQVVVNDSIIQLKDSQLANDKIIIGEKDKEISNLEKLAKEQEREVRIANKIVKAAPVIIGLSILAGIIIAQ